jgi:hypothetical protein
MDAETTCSGLTYLASFVDILRGGGPWTLMAIMIIFYVRKDQELRLLYGKMIEMSTTQATISAKSETTLNSLQDMLVTALERGKED